MTPKKLRFSHKLALAMVLLLALVILFSGTFRGLVHPRVTVTRVNSGAIQLIFTQEDVRLDPACLFCRALPLSIAGGVSVRETLKAPGTQVKVGDALLALDREASENAYFASKQAYIAAKLALDDFDSGYPSAVTAAKEALDDAESALARLRFAPEERRAGAEQAVRDARRAYDRLVVDGIWQHTTRDVLENDFLQASERYEAWSALRKKNYRVIAEEKGTLIYLTDAPVCEYAILPDEHEVTLSVTAPTADFEGIYTGQEAQLMTSANPDDAQTITVSETTREAGTITLLFQFVPETPSAFCVTGNYTMKFDSTKYLALIPASALVRDNMIWIAEPVRNGSKTSYVARSMTIKRATGNAAFIPSDDWLGDTLVITQWDKPLSEGETVLLPKDVL